MNYSRTQIIIFFIAIVVLGWLLYPRTLFLGFIYEGSASLEKSENYYQQYLAKKPFNRFATLRLVDIYERMGEPEKATPLYTNLYSHRLHDWDLAQKYLKHLENKGDFEAAYKLRQEIAHNFFDEKNIPREKIQDLLTQAFKYAQWKQKTEEAYQLLQKIADISKNPDATLQTLHWLDLGLKHTDKIIARLKKQLAENPHDKNSRRELISVQMASKNFEEAYQTIDEGLTQDPRDTTLLKQRIQLDAITGKSEIEIKDTLKILNLATLSSEETIYFKLHLVFLYQKIGRLEEALPLFEELTKTNPKNKDIWKNWAFVLTQDQKIDAALKVLEKSRFYFPDDLDLEEQQVSLLLYQKKDTSSVALYDDFLKKKPKPSFALDVAYLLLDQKEKNKAQNWLNRALKLFPENDKLIFLLADVNVELGLLEDADFLLTSYLKKHPNNSTAHLKTAHLAAIRFQFAALEQHLQQYLSLEKNKFQSLIAAGQEYLFAGLNSQAQNYFQKARDQNPKDPTPWFWLSAAYWSQNSKKSSQQSAHQASLLFSKKKSNTTWERLSLKAQAMARFDEDIRQKYKKALERHPKDFDFYADFADVLLMEQENTLAAEIIKTIEQKFSQRPEDVISLKVRLAQQQHDWKEVIDLLNNHPKPYLRDTKTLAEAYAANGQWKKAMDYYQQLSSSSDEEAQKKLGLTEEAAKLHAEYDHRIGQNFHYLDLGNDTIIEEGIFTKHYLNESLKITGEFVWGHYQSPGIDFEGNAEYGRILLSKQWGPQWQLEGGLGFGVSEQHETVSPLLGIRYKPWEKLLLEMQGSLRELRTDLPQSVARGALKSQVSFQWNWQATSRFNFSGTYRLGKNSLSGGEKAWEQSFEPSLSFLLLRQPDVFIGYQFSLVHVDDNDGFLRKLPLLPDVRAHYLTAGFNHPITPTFKVASGFFLGEDTARNLHFFEGDLWGANASFVWNLTSWLDMTGFYSYGRETLTESAGQSHNLNFGFSGHW